MPWSNILSPHGIGQDQVLKKGQNGGKFAKMYRQGVYVPNDFHREIGQQKKSKKSTRKYSAEVCNDLFSPSGIGQDQVQRWPIPKCKNGRKITSKNRQKNGKMAKMYRPSVPKEVSKRGIGQHQERKWPKTTWKIGPRPSTNYHGQNCGQRIAPTHAQNAQNWQETKCEKKAKITGQKWPTARANV